MENEEEYQRVVSFLDQLRSMNEGLNERSLLMTYSDTTKAIELHFEKCSRALAQRKEALLSEAASKLQHHKKMIEQQQKEVGDSIVGCARILEGGELLYSSNKDIAVAIWKNISTIQVPKLEEALVGVKLPDIILDVIGTHGTVTSEAKRISRSKAGYVSTLTHPSKDQDANLTGPSAMHFVPDDGLYVCDQASHAIKKVSPQGSVSTITNLFKSMGGISVHHKDSIIYASDPASHTIKKRAETSGFFAPKFDNFVGSGTAGSRDGVGTQASFKSPGALAVDQLTGDLYVADIGNHTIRKVTPHGVVSTIAGTAGMSGETDGLFASFNFSDKTALWFCNVSQMLYICDGNRVRTVTTHGEVSTIPCNINAPRGIVTLSDGCILVSSSIDNKIFQIKKLDKDKYDVMAIAGSGEGGNEDGIPKLCKFHIPHGIAFDESTNTCFVADYGNHCVKKFSFA